MKHVNLSAAIIFGIATLQGLLLASNLIYIKKGTRVANFFLAGVIAVITLIVFQNFIILSGNYTEAPYLIFLFYPLNGLIGPFFFMYVVFLLSPIRRFKKYDALHLVPFLYMLYDHMGFYFLPEEIKFRAVEYFYYSDSRFHAAKLPTVIFWKFVLVVYASAAMYLILSKIKELKNRSSNANHQYLNRFKWVACLFLAYALSSTLGQVYSYVFEVSIGLYEIYHHVINSVIVLFLTVIAMQQPERLVFTLLLKRKQPKEPSQIILNNLMKLMQDTKPYLSPELKLYELAQLAGVPPHVLSNMINQNLKMNFHEFVNQYRVEEFKQRIASPDYEHLTLLAIAYDVGFNSKASFNRTFKKHVGMTPSQYSSQQIGINFES